MGTAILLINEEERILNYRLFAGVAGFFSLSAFAAAQTDLDLTYSESSAGAGLYSYDMTLSVDQTNGAWSSGMGWTIIIFGDVPSATSPLADFNLTSAVPAPFGETASSSGGHNGPTWAFDSSSNLVYWVPTAATDTISWSGTSAYDASTQGPLYFSELVVEGGAGEDNWKEMTPVPAPEPASMLALAGLGGLILRRRARR